VELAESLGDAHRLAVACVRKAGFFTYTGQYAEARRAGERALAPYTARRMTELERPRLYANWASYTGRQATMAPHWIHLLRRAGSRAT